MTSSRRIAAVIPGTLARAAPVPLALLAVVLLFVGGPGPGSPRSVAAAWDLGHVPAFALFGWLLLSRRSFGEWPARKAWILVLVFCAAGGALTEGLQAVAGREPSAGDVARDVVGGAAAAAFLSPSRKTLPKALERSLQALAAVLVLLAAVPLGAALYDESDALVRFPVLSGFESPFEASRWDGSARFRIDRTESRRGRASLRVDFDASAYSRVSLVHFPGDWRGYSFLRLSVLVPDDGDLTLHIRIHDALHDAGGQRTRDRYDAAVVLRPGWNDLSVPLADAARAPEGREMDMGAVRGVGFFVMSLPSPRTVYLDDVRLER